MRKSFDIAKAQNNSNMSEEELNNIFEVVNDGSMKDGECRYQK